MAETSRVRALSSPDLVSGSSTSNTEQDLNFKGIATNVKILLKLIQEHNEASTNEKNTQRMAGMMSILDDVKSRVKKSQDLGKKREVKLRRCNTDLKPPMDKKLNEPTDEKEKIRKQLSSSLAARKSLEIMCSSVGKEKEIIAKELARRVHELDEMEELVNDLKAQNEKLFAKVQACANEHKGKKSNGEDNQANATLKERNNALSEQLLKSLDGYRSLKRKLKDAQAEKNGLFETIKQIGLQVQSGIERLNSLTERINAENEQKGSIEEEISALENMFQFFNSEITKHIKPKSDTKPKKEVNANKPPVSA